MSNLFLTLVDGIAKTATAISQSLGAESASQIISTDLNGKIDPSLMPVGIDLAVETIVASQALAAGDFVRIYDDSGTRKVCKADATDSTKEANGFVLANVSSNSNATVYLRGINNQLSGLTAGASYFLSDSTPGKPSATAPALTTGHLNQILGKAVSATALNFEYDAPTLIG